ncbi:MAG: choloylglycine hydrolase family protein [Deltaproteobacteria bacterium]|jgi:choloylglycine hydrolase|nr:choloylglycine hydrolase family protein [Deltaproteobacteria bacterium]
MLSKVSRYLKLAFFVLCVLSQILFHPAAEACTGIMLRTADGGIVHGRTLEFGIPIDTSIVVVPRGYEFVGKAPGGPGLKYKAKYAAVGSIAFDYLAIADGMNEKGLAIGAFYLPTFAKYTEITDVNRSKALSPLDFTNWVLSQFATVGEVRAAIERGEAVIAPTVLEGWGTEAPPLHYAVYDSNGACLVVEPVDGKLKIYDNPIGTLTNSPTFDWHLTNLRNYLALSPINVPQVDIDGVKLQQLGQGDGMLGLPGDYTPPSRFVRASFFSAAAIPSPNVDLGVQQIFHILNNFDIPLGSSRQKDGKVFHSDFTQATTARDPKNLCYYYRTYDDQTIRMVDLNKFDLDAKEVKKLNTKGSQPIVDMSNQLK